MNEVITKSDLAKILSRLPFLKLPLTNLVDGSTEGEVEMVFDTSATSGTDKEIYDALVALGWDSDVIG